MKKTFYILIIVIMITSSSCTKQQGPVVPDINPISVSFSEDIQPIFNDNCLNCHTATLEEHFGYLNLEAGTSYEDLVNIESYAYAPYKRVEKGDPENSILWQKINESGNFSSNMPLGAESLSENQQNLIKTWIQEGALNN